MDRTADFLHQLRSISISDTDPFNDDGLGYKTQLNDSLPVSRLPPEILEHVFLLHAECDHPHFILTFDIDGKKVYPAGIDLAWLKATHVCRRWRQIALGYTELWRHVDSALGPHWVREMISRAKATPLCLTADLHSRNAFMGDVISSNLHNTQMLSLVCDPISNGTRRVASSLFKKPAPLLESLVFMSHLYSWDGAVTIFHGGAPRLRHLTVRQCGVFPWNSPVLRQLVTLEIHELIHPDYMDVLVALEEMKAVEVLVLRSGAATFPPWIALPQRAGGPITLPSLVQLTLAGVITYIAWILTHTRLAKTTKLSITCFASESTRTDFQSVLPVLAETGCNLAYPRVVYGSVFETPWDRLFFVRAWSSASHPEQPTDKPGTAESDFHLAFNWARGSGPHDHLGLLAAAHQVLSHDGLVDLQVGVHSALWTPQVWLDVFGACLERVRGVRVNSIAAPSFVEALALDTSRGGVVAPRLASLGIKVRFDQTLRRGAELHARLLRTLRRRKARGAVLGRLALFECLLAETQLDELRELVPSIDSW
ncbi:hypothetical protein BV25DRAFT_1921966 [Artomyces pyxidatus]|uniref:Uncharacterized protein n=1 Tax=Artomyces pyxidatus TaxID=48021 RepID=A0ACB8SFW2_9AGAM|nr:hypothetical protein BV25DRAFT_1921966 [Artomyces pyxidatus]